MIWWRENRDLVRRGTKSETDAHGATSGRSRWEDLAAAGTPDPQPAPAAQEAT